MEVHESDKVMLERAAAHGPADVTCVTLAIACVIGSDELSSSDQERAMCQESRRPRRMRLRRGDFSRMFFAHLDDESEGDRSDERGCRNGLQARPICRNRSVPLGPYQLAAVLLLDLRLARLRG